MNATLYVYFTVPERAAALAPRLAELQARLAASTGIAGHLMRRRDDAATWMEVYEAVADPDAFAARRGELWAALDLDGFALAPHLEWFVPLTAPQA
ncbi:DUF4936 family protein [Crenobacter cavernae]|uniref:DUF4936 family protein n=1 Tax=Crenobacter cavernae TaxID=2290923 RepID=A0A345Y705_9NEIS|nr:DUF4936 family protein [Crenobacter cavernae]AXK39707.1 DUF4936 family protein [Crenobacter cavernae]